MLLKANKVGPIKEPKKEFKESSYDQIIFDVQFHKFVASTNSIN